MSIQGVNLSLRFADDGLISVLFYQENRVCGYVSQLGIVLQGYALLI